jgi:hypothetical protein
MSLSFFTGPWLVILKQVQDDDGEFQGGDTEFQDGDAEFQDGDAEVQGGDNPLFRHPELVSGYQKTAMFRSNQT